MWRHLFSPLRKYILGYSKYIFTDQSEAFQLVRGRLACLPPQTRQDKQREARRWGFACHVSSFTSRAN